MVFSLQIIYELIPIHFPNEYFLTDDQRVVLLGKIRAETGAGHK